MKTTRLIGSMCKYREVLSKAVLIGRGLDPIFSRVLHLPSSSIFSFEGIYLRKENMHGRKTMRMRPVSMTVRIHLFPFRTQKLSSLVPKIVGWKRPVKIGRRRLLKENSLRAEPMARAGGCFISTISSAGSVINSH